MADSNQSQMQPNHPDADKNKPAAPSVAQPATPQQPAKTEPAFTPEKKV